MQGLRHGTVSFPDLPIRVLVAIAALLAPACGSTFEERAGEVIRHFAGVNYTLSGSPKYTFFYAEAKFHDHAVNGVAGRLAEARALVNAGLKNHDGNDPPFQLWRAMDCYLRWGHLFDAALQAKARVTLAGSPHYGFHNTENKVWMAAAARYLAQETWPGETFASGYSAADPTGRATLLAKMESFVRAGETEHNSPTYFAMHYGPLRSLADFAKDPEVKQRAALTAEWLLASAASEWLDGLWCAPTERLYASDAFGSQSTYGAGSSTLRLYFGGPTPTNWNSELVDAVQAAGSAYRPPALLVSLAQDRSEPYLHRETHHSVGTRFFCTTTMTREFSLYSQREIFSAWGSGGGMDQVQRWSLAFRRNGGNCRLFVQHPADTKVPDLGATEYEQVLQSRQALIGVWNLPETNVVGHKGQNSSNPILGWIPENPAALVNEASATGRIFLHYGNILIALHFTRPFAWDGRSRNFSLAGIRKLGLVLEVAEPARYAGATPAAQLAAFQAAFEKGWSVRVDTTGLEEAAPRLAYTALDGSTLETAYRGADRLDGKMVVYDRAGWPLLENPRVHQRHLGDTLVVRQGNWVRTYDFKNWIVTETGKPTALRTPIVPRPALRSPAYRLFDPRGRAVARGVSVPAWQRVQPSR